VGHAARWRAARSGRHVATLERPEHVADLGIDEILVPADSPLVGTAGALVALERETSALVLALRRLDGELFTGPDAGITPQADDLLVLLGTRAELQATAEQVQGRP